MVNKITFTKGNKNFVLDAFDKTVDKDGFLVEKTNQKQRVLAPDGNEVSIDEFAGFRKGSEVVIKSDILSLIELCDSISE